MSEKGTPPKLEGTSLAASTDDLLKRAVEVPGVAEVLEFFEEYRRMLEGAAPYVAANPPLLTSSSSNSTC
jgi:hypothetical protein